MTLTKRLTGIAFVAALAYGAGGQLKAQDAATNLAAPESVPPEVADMFDQAQANGAEIQVAPSEEPSDAEAVGDGAAATGSRYLYTSLRVTTNGNPRGCGYANWNCMTQLCRSDLSDSSAWRGWAGCWRRDSWICYFECGQRRAAF